MFITLSQVKTTPAKITPQACQILAADLAGKWRTLAAWCGYRSRASAWVLVWTRGSQRSWDRCFSLPLRWFGRAVSFFLPPPRRSVGILAAARSLPLSVAPWGSGTCVLLGLLHLFLLPWVLLSRLCSASLRLARVQTCRRPRWTNWVRHGVLWCAFSVVFR
ncbi:unnamed protein product [Amoebophrya sp. A25]|nr:unnamed protein product [Amoebophrya sp. A25]|eukprot:GSA25T00021978001.1